MFHQDEEEDVSVSSLTLDDEDADARTGTLTYDEVVKDMIMEETQYIRELNLIIKVFRKMFVEERTLFSEELSLCVHFARHIFFPKHVDPDFAIVYL